MKNSCLTILLLASALSYSQERDSLTISLQKRDSIKSIISHKSIEPTAPPLLGGITASVLVSPVQAKDDDFLINQNSLEMGSPIYGNAKGEHPYFGKLTLKYMGLNLSDNEIFGDSNFHNVQVMLAHTHVLPRKKTVTLLSAVGVGSDFQKGLNGEDINFNAGIRIGWAQNSAFIYGLTIVYVNNYVGQFLLPIPDFNWKIDTHWSLTAILPKRTSLKYNFSQYSSLGLNIEMNTGNFRFHDSDDGETQFLNLFQYNGGLNYETVFAKHWKVNLFAGYTLVQRLQTIDSDKKAGLNDFQSLNDDNRANISLEEKSSIFQLSISYAF